ncbi:unnamed protein product [Rhizopus stolonifer]
MGFTSRCYSVFEKQESRQSPPRFILKNSSSSNIQILEKLDKNDRNQEEEESLVNDILKKAAEEPIEKNKSYSGTGHQLGNKDKPLQEEPISRQLTFWRNGFSVDDGPLFEYSDPANQQMLTAINEGRAPLSLLDVRQGQPVEVRVIKRQEDYRPKTRLFKGSGYRLGSPATLTRLAVLVDQSQPVTSIQIRLGDGSRLIAKLNHTHTVGDIRHYIEA